MKGYIPIELVLPDLPIPSVSVITIHHNYIKHKLEILFFTNMTCRQYWLLITVNFQLLLHEHNWILAFAWVASWINYPTWMNYSYCWLLHLKELFVFVFKFSWLLLVYYTNNDIWVWYFYIRSYSESDYSGLLISGPTVTIS